LPSSCLFASSPRCHIASMFPSVHMLS
jgi:hypothetical protein